MAMDDTHWMGCGCGCGCPQLWVYELYGGAQLAPHRLYVLARYLTPPKGVWEGPRAPIHLPRNTRCRLLFPPPCAFLAWSPCAWEVCLLSSFVIPPLPPRKEGHTVGAQKTNNHM
eukprot:scaffold1228_cov115-Isochrysis_galbana.AAC.11